MGEGVKLVEGWGGVRCRGFPHDVVVAVIDQKLKGFQLKQRPATPMGIPCSGRLIVIY